jgi:hypothetical protein
LQDTGNELPPDTKIATAIIVVSRRKKNQFNPVVDGPRFNKDRLRNDNTYYKYTLFINGCKSRITLDENNNLVSAFVSRSHEPPIAETKVK